MDFYGLERRRVFPEASSPMASNFKRLLSESDQVQRAQDKSDMFAHADARGSEIHALFIGGIDFGKANAGMSNWAYSTDGFARSTYHIDGVDSVVYEIGEGKPLVYLHGGGTYHGFEWARDFADDFRVILPHHPNFGESDDADFSSVADYMLHYEMLFAALELEQFYLMGASLGGHFAARYAGDHPDEIDRLVLVAPAGLVSQYAAMPNFEKIAPQDIPAMFVSDPAWLAPFWPAEPSAEWQALRQRESKAAFATREDSEATDAKLREVLAGFDRPTLLLWGAEDRIVPPGFAKEWQEILPHAELAVIDGGGHLLLDENLPSRSAAKAFLLG